MTSRRLRLEEPVDPVEIDSVVDIASSDEIHVNLADDSSELEPVASEPSSDVDAIVVRMTAEHETLSDDSMITQVCNRIIGPASAEKHASTNP